MVQLNLRDNQNINDIIAKHPYVRVERALSGGFLVISVPADDVIALTEEFGHTKVDAYSIVVGLLGESANDAAGIKPIQQQPYLDLRGSGVLLGFIDTGIDYTSPAFIYENGNSKIQYIWDQSIEGGAPDSFSFGTEYGNEAINEALKKPNPFDAVPHRDSDGHGTRLAAIAGGREEGANIGAAPDSEIVMVKLRRANDFYRDVFQIPPDQENAFESIDVMLGVEYILSKAYELKRPVSICISVGTNSGGHDGHTVFENYLSYVSHQTGVVICCAAGNEGNTGHHASGKLAKTGDERRVEVSVGNNAGDLYLVMFSSESDRFAVSVVSPTGEMVGRVPARNGTSINERLIFENATVSVYYFFPIEGSGGQLTSLRITDATPGIWSILVYGEIIVSGEFGIWLPVTGFVDPSVQFLSPNPHSTVVIPATTTGVITCGAFNGKDGSIYAASSWGPSRQPAPSPDICAPGVDEMGITGTCASAAVTAGACALLLQWGLINGNEPMMDTYLARADLIRGAVREENLTYPNDQWGYGKLDLKNTFVLMRRT